MGKKTDKQKASVTITYRICQYHKEESFGLYKHLNSVGVHTVLQKSISNVIENKPVLFLNLQQLKFAHLIFCTGNDSVKRLIIQAV